MGQVKSKISGFFSNNTNVDCEQITCSKKVIRASPVPSYLRYSNKRENEDSEIEDEKLNLFKRIKLNSEQKYLDFPFLNDGETIKFYRNSKVMIILRGLSGSGKSTVAKSIEYKYIISKICSADFYFYKNGKYEWDKDLLKEAHKTCQQCAIDAAMNQTVVIVIDNTNLQLWEMKFYFKLAQEFGYITVVVEPLTPWKYDTSLLVSKTVHNITESTINFMYDKYEDLRPLYYGWFLNDKDSYLVLEEAKMWLKKLFESSEEFKQDIKRHNSSIRTLDDLFNHYAKPGKDKILHCTAKFIGGNISENIEYIEAVDSKLGQVYSLQIVGFVLTPRTLGARIRLSTAAKELWTMNDNEDVPCEFYDLDYEKHDMLENSTEDKINNEHLNGNGNHTNYSSQNMSEENKHLEKSVNENVAVLDAMSDDKTLPVECKADNGSVCVDVQSNGDLCSVSMSPPKTDMPCELNFNTEINNTPVKDTESDAPAAADTTNFIEPVITTSTHKRTYRKPNVAGLLIPKNTIDYSKNVTKTTLIPIDSNENEFCAPTFGTGSRAHLTLGCAPSVSPVTTGLDLIMTIKEEQNLINDEDVCEVDNSENFALCDDDGTIKHYGNGLWAFYPKILLKVSTVFSHYNT